MTSIVLASASLVILYAVFDLRIWRSEDLDRFVIAWIAALAAWPSVITYLVAPLIWTAAEESGPLFPALQYTPALWCSCWALWKGASDRRAEINVPALILSTLFLFSLVGVVVGGGVQLINLAVTVALYIGVLLRPKRVSLQSVGMGAVVSIGVVTIATTIAARANSDVIIGKCRIDKCNAIGEALTSPFAGNGNSLGLTLVLLTPFALAICSPMRSLALIAGVAAVLEVASSRSATVGFVVVVFTVCLVRLVRTPGAKMSVAYIGGVFALGLSLFPLYTDYSGSAYSFRGYLWEVAEKLIWDAPVFGHGATYWWVMGHSALFDANYSPHNGWFDIVVSLGLWAVLIILIAVVVQVRGTTLAIRPYLIAYYSGVLALSAFESVYVPYYLGITPFAAILPLILYDPVKSPVTNLVPDGSSVAHGGALSEPSGRVI